MKRVQRVAGPADTTSIDTNIASRTNAQFERVFHLDDLTGAGGVTERSLAATIVARPLHSAFVLEGAGESPARKDLDVHPIRRPASRPGDGDPRRPPARRNKDSYSHQIHHHDDS